MKLLNKIALGFFVYKCFFQFLKKTIAEGAALFAYF